MLEFTLDTMPNPLRLGTRASPLAMAQAHMAADSIHRTTGLPLESILIDPVVTVGDKVLDRPLAEIGGKALWTKELDGALLEGRIDFAVHSMKDVETWLPDGLVIAAVLPRADPRDRLIGVKSLAHIPEGAVVGTSSPRRVAQLLCRRPDVQTVTLRGNIATRLRQIEAGDVAASFLAAAGLDRLGMDIGYPLSLEEWIPAASQGIIGITCRADDLKTLEILQSINCAQSMKALVAERAVLEGLGGSCHTAVGVHWADGHLRAQLFNPDGSSFVEAEAHGEGTQELGLQVAKQLMAQATPAILASLDSGRRA